MLLLRMAGETINLFPQMLSMSRNFGLTEAGSRYGVYIILS